MPIDINFDDLGSLIEGVLDEIINDAKDSSREFWNGFEAEQLPEAKQAMKRYAENNLAALRYPEASDRHIQGAAHNINTIINLGAANKIAVRREARALMDRIMTRIFDAAASAIDIVL